MRLEKKDRKKTQKRLEGSRPPKEFNAAFRGKSPQGGKDVVKQGGYGKRRGGGLKRIGHSTENLVGKRSQ